MRLVALKHHCVDGAKRVVDLALTLSAGGGMFKVTRRMAITQLHDKLAETCQIRVGYACYHRKVEAKRNPRGAASVGAKHSTGRGTWITLCYAIHARCRIAPVWDRSPQRM